MEQHNHNPITVMAPGNGTAEPPVAVLTTDLTAFVFELAVMTGMGTHWAVNHIVDSYAKTWGTEPPDVHGGIEKEYR